MCRNAHDFFVVSDTLITFMACNINDKLMTVTDRFLKYVTFDTESSETTGVTPSTPGQRVFAEALVKELEEIGLEDITLDDKSYLMATLPANTAKEVPTIGFIAHLDTSPDMSGKDVEPRIVSYEGGDIVLCAEENVVLSPLMFPELDRKTKTRWGNLCDSYSYAIDAANVENLNLYEFDGKSAKENTDDIKIDRVKLNYKR